MQGTFAFTILIVIAFLHSNLHAQINSVNHEYDANYLGVGADFGITTFYGDLDQGPALDDYWANNKAYQFLIMKNFNALFELDGRLSFGDISGQKNQNLIKSSSNLYFKTKFTEYTIDAAVNLLGFFTRPENRKFGLYGKIGIGLIDFKTELYSGINDSLVKSLGYDNEATTEMVIPFGIKLIYHISHSSAISLQTTSSRVNTDKLDITANNNNSDYYNFVSLGYFYKFIYNNGTKRLFGRGNIKVGPRKKSGVNPSRRR